MLRVIRMMNLGFWFGLGMLAIPVVPAHALWNDPAPSITKNGNDITSPGRVSLGKATRIQPLRVATADAKKTAVLDKIGIGRLELRRNHNVDLNADSAVRFDPMEMVRSARHLVPKPAASLTFDLHWRDR